MKWETQKIGDLCRVGRGSSPRPINDMRYFEGGNIPWIKIADATSSERKIFATKLYVNEFGASFSRKLPEGSLIIGTSGTLGLPMFLGVEGCIHDGWLYVDDFKELDKNFLYYKLLNLKEYFYSKAYGAAIQNINTDILRETEIALPPLPIQKKIASILSAYDDLIENNLKRIALLEKSARLLYEEWFVRLRFPGYEHTSLINGVPEGWEIKKLGDIAEINSKNIKNTFEGEIEYIDIASVSPGSIDETNLYEFRDAPSRARRVVTHGDIIWSCVRPNRKSHAIIWKPKPNLIASTGFAVISPIQIPTSYLYHFLTTENFVGYLSNNAKGVAYPAVTAKEFEQAEVLIPQKDLLLMFSQKTISSIDVIHILKIQNQKLKQARDILLPKLINGEIAV